MVKDKLFAQGSKVDINDQQKEQNVDILTLGEVETASLCAEACLSLNSPMLCYGFSWNENSKSCLMVGHDSFMRSGVPVVVDSWTKFINPKHKVNLHSEVVVSGICRYSSAIPSERQATFESRI